MTSSGIVVGRSRAGTGTISYKIMRLAALLVNI
jgi:hypothetical protein